MKENFWLFVIGALYLAVLYTLVRPGSKGPSIVKSVFGTLTDLVRGVSGETYDPSTGKWSS